jgi:hypothetical protein
MIVKFCRYFTLAGSSHLPAKPRYMAYSAAGLPGECLFSVMEASKNKSPLNMSKALLKMFLKHKKQNNYF